MSKHTILILAAISASQGLAAQQDSSGVKELDQVVFSASKYPIKQYQAGKLVVVISHETIEQSAGKSLGQILNEQVGITVGGAYNALGTNQAIYLRGAASGRALVCVDGIPVSDPTMIDNGFDINLVPLDLVERIEICQGAQSVLFGSDAIAGVVNIITTKSQINRPFLGKASLAGGNEGTFRGYLQAYGKADGLMYNVRYSKLSSLGFASAYDSTGKGGFRRDAYDGDAVSSQLSWARGAHLTLKGLIQYSQYKTGLPGGAFEDATDYNLTSKNLMLGGGFSYRLPSVTITGNYLYNTATRLNLMDSSAQQPNYLRDNYFGKTQFVELYSVADLGDGFTLLSGADYRYASMNEQYLSVSGYGPYSTQFDDTSVSQTSMYSSLAYNNANGLRLEIGGRLNTHSRYGSNYTYSINPAWLIHENWKIYASLATGFKAPSLYELYSSYGYPGLQPEKSTNYEAGLQYSSKNWGTRASLFYRRILDGLDFDYVNYKYFNYDGEKAIGIEWEGNLQVNSWLGLVANYSWVQIRQQSESRVSFADTSYGYGLRQPEHTINFTLAVHPIQQLSLNLSGHYESKRYDIGGYQVPDVILNPFFILNAYAEYRLNSWLKLFVDTKNLTDKKFFTIYGYNSIPFQVLGGLTLTW
jgi:vitamin B12 transporter